MLRASASAFGYEVDVRSVVDRSVSSGVPGGDELLDLVDAVMRGGDAAHERQAVVAALDEPSLFDAATVHGNFQMMNRVAEASGIPVSPQAVERHAGLIEMLGIGGFRTH